MEKSVLGVDDIYRICNQQQFFTAGSSEQYRRVMRYSANGGPIRDVAIMIWVCSETSHSAEEFVEFFKKENQRIKRSRG